MATETVELSDKVVRDLPLSEQGQRVVRDTREPGFYVVVGKKTKTFTVQAELREDGARKVFKKALGQFPEIKTESARRAAQRAKADWIERRVTERAREAISLREAWEVYRTAMAKKGRSGRTIEGYDAIMRLYFAGWLDRTLKDLSTMQKQVQERHEQLTREAGPYAANGAMRVLRAVYRNAVKMGLAGDLLLERSPTRAVVFNPEFARENGMGLDGIAEWWAWLGGRPNPIRREWYLFMLLTGLRREDAARVRWADYDPQKRLLAIPNPKGGPSRAFVIPLTSHMVECLERARREGEKLHPEQARVWAFPAESAEGHVKQNEGKKSGEPHSPHALRRSMSTISEEVGLAGDAIDRFLNHKPRAIRDRHYRAMSPALLERLRADYAMVNDAIMAKIAEARTVGPAEAGGGTAP